MTQTRYVKGILKFRSCRWRRDAFRRTFVFSHFNSWNVGETNRMHHLFMLSYTFNHVMSEVELEVISTLKKSKKKKNHIGVDT